MTENSAPSTVLRCHLHCIFSVTCVLSFPPKTERKITPSSYSRPFPLVLITLQKEDLTLRPISADKRLWIIIFVSGVQMVKAENGRETI